MTELWRLSAGEMAAHFADGSLSPVDALKACLTRCAATNGALNAIVTFDEAGAHAAATASAARYKAGQALGPLDGVPLTVKDNLYVGGLRATWGSLLFEHHIAPRDDIAVERLRAAGAVIVGKTNTPEFAISAHTDNRVFGVSRNPWDTALTPGGSSGGAVASVAAGMLPLALATDAGGSIRRPAGYGGLVGLRPSTGRVARCHGFAPLALDFQAIGPIARTVADARLAFAILAGADPRDRLSYAAAAAADAAARRHAGRTGPLRIGLVTGAGGAPVEPAIVAATEAAAHAFADEAGCAVAPAAPPYDVEEIAGLFGGLSAAGLARVVAGHADWRERVDPAVIPTIEAGFAMNATDYVPMIDRLGALRTGVLALFDAVDIYLLPTSAAMPWPAATRFPATIAGRDVGPRGAAIFSTFVNALGLPGIALPAPVAEGSLPIGFQLVGNYGDDTLLLDLAECYESARPWRDRWPTIG
jgi:aspartyl-tRNA(Asn)/glutamyl-tRNA(Gln) amidotransferase subunit A